MSNIFKMLFFDAIYGGPIANGFGFLVTLHDSRNPFRGTVIYGLVSYFILPWGLLMF